jgi:hypothetical protein
MESVSIQIPAALYVAIYERHHEESGAVITACLSQLLDAEPSEGAARGAEGLQYPRPGAGTITGRVWEIADRILKEAGEANREAVIRACMNEGIKINTASTQFSHWRKANP